MPNIKSAIKRVKVTEVKRTANAPKKAAMRTAVKKVEKAEKIDKAMLSDAFKKIDKALSGGIIKKNAAARQKSRLAKKAK